MRCWILSEKFVRVFFCSYSFVVLLLYYTKQYCQENVVRNISTTITFFGVMKPMMICSLLFLAKCMECGFVYANRFAIAISFQVL